MATKFIQKKKNNKIVETIMKLPHFFLVGEGKGRRGRAGGE